MFAMQNLTCLDVIYSIGYGGIYTEKVTKSVLVINGLNAGEMGRN